MQDITEIDLLARKATVAFHEFRKVKPDKKALFLELLGRRIAEGKAELAAMAGKETHLPQARLEGEITRTINQITLFSELLKEGSWVKAIIDPGKPGRLPMPKPDTRQMQFPIGVVAVFGAGNFPFAFSVAGNDTISALGSGCPVIYKVHPGHPVTSTVMAQIISEVAGETGMPDGIFLNVSGTGNEAGIALVTHPLIKAVGFTGSFNGGKALYDAAARRPEPIPVYAEMGSVNPTFIFPGMQKNPGDLAAKLAASNLLNAGQFCTNPGVIVSLKNEETENFISQFARIISEAPGEKMLTENILRGYYSSIDQISDTEIRSIAKGMKGIGTAAPYSFQTDAKTFIKNKRLSNEVFGPFSLHVVAETKEELLEIIKILPGQLTVSAWADEEDLRNFGDIIHELELKAGRVIFNQVPTGVEVTAAMMHGGPYPATTDAKFSSIGSGAIYRFTRPVCFQNCPDHFLPEELQNKNPLKIWRQVDGEFTKETLE